MDLKKVEETKKIVTDFYHAYGIEKDAEKCRQFFGDKYIQHNPHVQDGVDHFLRFVRFRKELSRNRIRVKERDGKSETGKGRESQSYQGKQRTSMRRPPRRGRALSSSTRTAARGSSGGFLYS